MNDKNKEILMMGQDSLMEFYLSQNLKSKGFSTHQKDILPAKLSKNTPVIFFLLNGELKSLNDQNGGNFENIEQFLQKKHLQYNPIFIITTQTVIDYFSRIDHLGAIIEIQIDPSFHDVINLFEKMENTVQTVQLNDIDRMIDAVGEVIIKYLQTPPHADEYIIEEVSTRKCHHTVGVVGLGYVGLPVAVGFSKKYHVIGFDINKDKINSLRNHIDLTGEISEEELKTASIEFTTSEHSLQRCDYIIIVVPTPITSAKKPNLQYLKNASKIVGRNLTSHTVVIYESTVYPGTTEDVCIPILEEHSNLIAGEDFYVGYSPERINPGDKEHTFKRNSKVVSGQDKKTLEKIYKLYNTVIEAEVYKAPSIKVAEACKIVENTQRDINIALMNELAIIFNHLNIDTTDVLKAAQTKWNFIPFTPGLVGGHCIGVDPYYLIYQSQLHGYEPTFISSARKLNDQMPDYIVQSLFRLIVEHQLNVSDLRITVLGITFKENLPDIRNSKALEIVTRLQDIGMSVQVCDPMLSPQSVQDKDIDLRNINQIEKAQIIIFAVPHQSFEYTDKNFFNNLLMNNQGIVMDIKGIIPNNVLHKNITHWKL